MRISFEEIIEDLAASDDFLLVTIDDTGARLISSLDTQRVKEALQDALTDLQWEAQGPIQ